MKYAVGIRLDKIDAKLDALLEYAQIITDRLEKLMTLAQDELAALEKLNQETTKVGDLITTLASRIKNSMTDQEVADVKTAFGALSDRLTALAVDPTNPVPPPSSDFEKAKAAITTGTSNTSSSGDAVMATKERELEQHQQAHREQAQREQIQQSQQRAKKT